MRDRTATALKFDYDDAGDTPYISKVKSYAEQETEQLEYNVLARRNPRTGAIGNLEVLFFTRRLLKGCTLRVDGLADQFADPAEGARA